MNEEIPKKADAQHSIKNKPDKFKVAIMIVAGLIILFAGFGLGEVAGFERANFSYRWGENYHNLFGGPRGGFIPGPGFTENGLQDSHGVAGTVIKVDADTIVIKGSDNIEKEAEISTSTIIRKGDQNLSLSNIDPDDMVVILGMPNGTGQIQAEFIRVFSPQQ